MNHFPTLLLGTAQFGWTTERKTAFELLDAFYENSFRQVDCATNYPINKNSSSFRAAEKIIQEWVRAHGVKDLRLMMKIGSVNNLRTPECNLSPSFLLMSLEQYRNAFQENLDTLMIHWDNESEDEKINATFSALESIKKEGFQVGLSGIKEIGKYAKANEKYQLDFFIQVKNNIVQSDLARYVGFFPNEKYIAYGINAGGMKRNVTEYGTQSTLATRGGDTENQHEIFEKIEKIIARANENTQRPPIDSFFQLGMIHSFYEPKMHGILIANSSVAQWKTTLDFYKKMQNFDYSTVLKNN